ncbi:MAG: flagellar hook-length control protein FliK [Pseudomonadota bacterium]
MSQMVLPQTPAPGGQPESGSKKPPAGHEKSTESRFDSVSRAEQKRLDQKQAERRDSARANEQARQQPKERAERPADGKPAAENARSGRKEDPKADRVAEKDAAKATAEEGELASGVATEVDLPEELATLTFADLQALVAPAAGATTTPTNAGALQGASSQAPGLSGLAGVLAGLPGMKGVIPGQPAEATGKTAGQSLGFQFSEALSALSGESGRAQDSASLLGAGRVQTLADVTGQQLANAASKLAPDTAGLRGYATSVDVPVGHAEWGDKLVGKLTWLTANKLSVAEIHLTPPDMGPMEVRVQVQQEQANITVHAANPAVRDQLELHSHRLRDMLSEHGLSLEQFDVADSPQQQADGQEAGGEGGRSGEAPESELAEIDGDELDGASGALDLTWKGEVDTFA